MPFIIRRFIDGDTDAVVDIWRRCGLLHPDNDPRKDIRRKLKVRPDFFLVGTVDGAVIATVMIGYEGHRGCINYLGVLPEHQRRGYARLMMDESERLLILEGCPKINLHVRTTNASALSFYERLGFSQNKVVSLGKRLERDA